MKNIIFTSGYTLEDDDITKIKGHRSDVLVEDFENNFYELNFITIERLIIDFNINLANKKLFFTDYGLIIVKVVNKETIINTIIELIKENYFSTQKKLLKTDLRNDLENWYYIYLK